MLFSIVGTYEFDEIIVKDILTINYLNEIDLSSIVPLKSSQAIDYLEFGEVKATKDIPVLESVNGYSNLSDEFEVTAMVSNENVINSTSENSSYIRILKTFNYRIDFDKQIRFILIHAFLS